MSSQRTKIEFFYDVLSPYSFLAFEVLCRYQSKWNIDLQLKPVMLGLIMKLSGNSAPATVPNKALYMRNDLNRLQSFFQVPLSLPDNLMEIFFNKGSLKAQRFITAIDVLYPKYTESVSRQLWLRLYDTHEDITEFVSLIEAGQRAGMSEDIIDEVISKMYQQGMKDRLGLYTKQAMEYGAFGVPVIVAHVNGKAETFFGSDRFELLAHTIGERWDGPLPLPSKL